MAKLSHSVSGAFREFAFYLANRTLALQVLDGVDYDCVFNEASALEQAFAIFANVLDVGDDGEVINADHAQRRSAQFIRRFVDPAYSVDPPFASWELALH